MTRHPRAFDMLADSLNEYADLYASERDVPNHRPASPLYWFAGIYREARSVYRPGGPGHGLLNHEAQHLAACYEAMDVEDGVA